jgi:hypothetical protein
MFLAWISMNGFHFLDPQYLLMHDWKRVSPEKIIFLRMVLGEKPFIASVCAKIASYQAEDKGRQVLAALGLHDGAFLEQLDGGTKDPGTDLFDAVAKIRPQLYDAWHKMGRLE